MKKRALFSRVCLWVADRGRSSPVAFTPNFIDHLKPVSQWREKPVLVTVVAAGWLPVYATPALSSPARPTSAVARRLSAVLPSPRRSFSSLSSSSRRPSRSSHLPGNHESNKDQGRGRITSPRNTIFLEQHRNCPLFLFRIEGSAQWGLRVPSSFAQTSRCTKEGSPTWLRAG